MKRREDEQVATTTANVGAYEAPFGGPVRKRRRRRRKRVAEQLEKLPTRLLRKG